MESKPSLASPLDAHLPSAVVGAILMKYLDPENWARLRITAKGWETPAFAALLHPWRARAAELQKLVHAPAPPPASLTETLALLQHCSLADDSKSVGVGVIPRLRVDTASSARNVELRCPRRSWRPWMPLARRRVEFSLWCRVDGVEGSGGVASMASRREQCRVDGVEVGAEITIPHTGPAVRGGG